MKTLTWMLSLCLLPWLISTTTFASTGEIYGYGSKASALGNTMLSGARDGYATFYNPAANSSHPGLSLSYGITYAHHSFKDISNVVVANSATSASTTEQLGDVDTSYLDEFGQVIGLSLNMGESLKNFTVGFTGFMPLTRVAYLDTGEAFLPEYFTYRSRVQRPMLYVSASIKPFPHFYLAAGISLNTSLSSKADMHLSTVQSSVSYARFSTTIKPGAVPYFSIYTDPKPLELGLTVRLPSRAKSTIDTNADARFLGPTAGLPLVTTLTNPIYYDPFEVDFASSYQLTKKTWGTLEVDYIRYSDFESPAFSVSGSLTGNTLQPSVSNLPPMRDIFVPKVGLEHEFETVTCRLGYFWRQSPVKDNSGIGNLVDPEKHVFTAGIGIDLKKAKLVERPVTLDFHVQYHLLVTQHITKSPGNEAGIATQSKIGSPGYDIGGHIFGGGLSITMNL